MVFAVGRTRVVGSATVVWAVLLVASPARGQSDLTLTSGSQATAADESFGSVFVSGTSPAGVRSTLSVTGPITIGAGLVVSESGLIVASAAVDLGGSSGYVFDGGSLQLSSGTFSADSLYLTGTASLVQSGGAYAVHALSLSDGAGATVTAADRFLESGAAPPVVTLSSGATLTLATNLAGLAGGVDLQISGSAGGLVRTSESYALDSLSLASEAALAFRSGDSIATNVSLDGGSVLTLEANLAISGNLSLFGAGSVLSRASETISVDTLTLGSGAGFTLVAGDVFSNLNVGAGSTLTLSSTAALPVLAVQSLVLGGTIAGLDERPYSVGSLVLDATSLALRSGAIDDSVTGSVSLFNGATFTLGKDLVLTDPLSFLMIQGAASGLDRAGHGITVGRVELMDGASFTVESGDTVTDGLAVSGYGDPTTLTLGRSIVITGTNPARGIFLSGPAATIARSGPFSTITGSGATVAVTDGATFAIASGDWLPDAVVAVASGGVLSNSEAQSFSSIDVRDVGSRYQADAALAITSTSGSALFVGSGGVFAAAANVNVTDAIFDLGTLQLLSGTFTAESLAITGSGGFVRDPGAFYAVGDLALHSQATITFMGGDSIATLSLDGLSELTANSALAIDALSISGGAVLDLAGFNGGGLDGYVWGLRLPGDQQSALAAWVASGAILATESWEIVFDDSGPQTYTYAAVAVPEPGGLALAGVGLLVVAAWRRRWSKPAAGEGSR